MAASSFRSHRTVERAAQAHVGAAVPEKKAFLPGPPEGCPVGEALAEVGVPRIEMRVEVDQGQRTVAFGRGAEQR
jgi:hypothetical protein